MTVATLNTAAAAAVAAVVGQCQTRLLSFGRSQLRRQLHSLAAERHLGPGASTLRKQISFLHLISFLLPFGICSVAFQLLLLLLLLLSLWISLSLFFYVCVCLQSVLSLLSFEWKILTQTAQACGAAQHAPTDAWNYAAPASPHTNPPQLTTLQTITPNQTSSHLVPPNLTPSFSFHQKGPISICATTRSSVFN